MDADVIVIGAGAAGMVAAATAASEGSRVLLIEKKEAPGKKLLITGKGRCNLTNSCSQEEFLQNIPANPKFLYSALQAFSVEDCMEYFTGLGVALKVERGNRVFPVSDKSADVVQALLSQLDRLGVRVLRESAVTGIKPQTDGCFRVAAKSATRIQGEQEFSCRALIVATGGLSAPGTGSTGDGYQWAKSLGHTIKPLQPSLVPLESEAAWVWSAQGLTLKNAQVTLLVDGKAKAKAKEFGELLFTHWGVSGPVVLTLSDLAVQALAKGSKVELAIDLKPALSREQLDQRVQRDFGANLNKQYKNSLGDLLPKSLIPVILQLSGINGDKAVHQITREERLRLVDLLKMLTVPISRARSIKEAVVTAGGVAVKEINPRTMESRLVPGLFFAGEILDVHGYTGGFNLQIAWSTGYLAGKNASCH